jgi:hypothetical protein
MRTARARSRIRTSTAIALTLGGLVWLGCHRTDPSTASRDCVGGEQLIVRNETGEAVDVYSNAQMLGSAAPGRTEFILPADTLRRAFRGRRSSGQWITATYGGQARRSELTFEVVCRYRP